MARTDQFVYTYAKEALVYPQFPDFQPIALEDRDEIRDRLRTYQPENSELTFTNLFIWRAHYGFLWSVLDDCLTILSTAGCSELCVLPPVGPAPRAEVTRTIIEWLKKEKGVAIPCIDRADRKLVAELADDPRFEIESLRDQFDYVYRSEDLIQLAGGAYRAKRNHINYFMRTYGYAYEPLDESHIKACLALSENWCDPRRCEEDLNLLGEWDAIREALTNFTALGMAGGVILVDGKVEAFALGERLNEQTAVVHIEKANTEIRGLYAAINQQFCERQWQGVPFVNREQDLGEAGLREAKLSYNPDHLVEKYRICLRQV